MKQLQQRILGGLTAKESRVLTAKPRAPARARRAGVISSNVAALLAPNGRSVFSRDAVVLSPPSPGA